MLAASIVLLVPFTMVFEVLLRAGLEACEIAMGEVRRNDSITVHSLVKNGAHALIRQVQADNGADQETRSLADSMLVLAEEARQMMLGGGPPAETVALLWDCVLQVVPGDRRAGMILDARSRHLQMRKTDYGLARRVLPDLVTNAWKAGAQRVEVAVRQENPQRDGSGSDPGPLTRPWVTVSVDDDGPGMPASLPGPGPACGSSMSTCTVSTAPWWPSGGRAAAPGAGPLEIFTLVTPLSFP